LLCANSELDSKTPAITAPAVKKNRRIAASGGVVHAIYTTASIGSRQQLGDTWRFGLSIAPDFQVDA